MLGFLGVRLLRWLHAKAGELCARGTASRVATATETRWGVKFARDEKVRGNQSIPYTVGGVSIRRREARLQRSSRSSHFKPTSSHVSTRNFFYPTRETPTRPHSMNWGTRYTVHGKTGQCRRCGDTQAVATSSNSTLALTTSWFNNHVCLHRGELLM